MKIKLTRKVPETLSSGALLIISYQSRDLVSSAHRRDVVSARSRDLFLKCLGLGYFVGTSRLGLVSDIKSNVSVSQASKQAYSIKRHEETEK